MQKIRSIVVDDEQHSIETLVWKITSACPEVEVIAQFSVPAEALEFLNSNPIDLLFLDIEMPVISGFDLLKRVDNVSFDVIFTTAYDDYAIRAIKYSALDYLLKPIDMEDLQQAVERHQAKQQQQVMPEQLEVLLNSLRRGNSDQKIVLSTKESIEMVKPADIILCESDNNYTTVFMDGKKKLLSKTLKEFEELLSPHNFLRTHQSFLINTDHIREYRREDGGYLVMSNGRMVPISRKNKEMVLSLFSSGA